MIDDEGLLGRIWGETMGKIAGESQRVKGAIALAGSFGCKDRTFR